MKGQDRVGGVIQVSDIVIRPSRRLAWSNFAWLGGLIAFFGVIWAVVTGDLLVWLVGMLWYVGWGLLRLVVDWFALFDRAPRMVIRDDGLLLPRDNHQLILWSVIGECELQIDKSESGVLLSAKLLLGVVGKAGEMVPRSIEIAGLERTHHDIYAWVRERWLATTKE